MSIAAKHLDPQLGIDIHMYAVPPSPLPTPHIGLVLDPFDYIPFIGSTIKVNGVHRATAGTGGLDVHIPLGVWAPPLAAPMGPQFDGEEIFMGSRTVSADGEPFSRLAMPVLDCNLAGMINPFRVKKPKKPLRAMSLPTGLNVAIPSSVTVGGPPTISWTAMAFRAAFAGLGKLRKSKFFQGKMDAFKKWRQGKWGHLPSGTLKCKILRAEPVDIRDGSVVVSHRDFEIPGRLPFAWQRSYSSAQIGRGGACGIGWQTAADITLEVLADGSVWMSGPGEVAFFPELPPVDGEAAAILDFVDGARLLRRHGQLRVRFKGGLQYVFGGDLPSGVAALPAHGLLALERIEDASGNYWRFERNDGHLVRIVESGVDGLQGRFIDVDARHGRIERMALHDPATGLVHPLVSYRYSSEGDLAAALDALGAARTFVYQQHRLVQHTDRVGLSFYYAFDAQGRVVHSWGDGGLYDYHFEYDALLRETRVTDSLGHLSVIKFDENQLPLCEIDPLDGVTFFEYDDFGRTVAVTDPEGLRTGFAYDAHGNLCCLTRADGSSFQFNYDALDNMVVLRTPDGATWKQEFDDKFKLVAQVDPLGARTNFEYSPEGQLLAQQNARHAITRLRYDRHGLVCAVIDALGSEARYASNPLGNLLQQVDALGQTNHYEYDKKGRLLVVLAPEGTSIRCEYDAEDQLIRYVDEAGTETRLEYVGIGQVSTRTQADGYSVQYRYDSEQQLIAVINQRGESYQLVRDALGRIVNEVDYWGQERRYGYDAAGRLKSVVDALGQRISFSNDKLGRIVRKTMPDVRHPGRQVQEHFGYDKIGRLTELRNPARSIKRRYDPTGKMLEELQDGFKVSYGYDEVGNRVSRRTSAGNCVAIVYDLLDQAVSIAINDESPILMQRDALGRITQEVLSPHLLRNFSYNSSNLMTSQSILKDAAPLLETSYDYDRSGNLVRRSDSDQGVDEYRYDVIGRLLQHTDPKGKIERFFTDPAGDRLRTEIKQVQARRIVGGESDAQGTWTREGTYQGVHYVFDRGGDLVRRGSPQGGSDDLTFVWDANHRLAESTKDRVTTDYGYDPLGRRVFKRNRSCTTWFFWDGDALLGEVQQANDEDEVVPIWVGNVASLVEVRARQQQLSRLHERVREYVYCTKSFVPLALIEPGKTANDGLASVAQAEITAGAIREIAAVDSSISLEQRAQIGLSIDQSSIGRLGGIVLGERAKELGPSVVGGASRSMGISLATPQRIGRVEDSKPAPVAMVMGSRPDSGSVLLGKGLHRVYIYQCDPNGAPHALIDRFGAIAWSAGSGTCDSSGPYHGRVANRIGLQGQYHDDETGLAYARHRYFSSDICAFVSKDPIRILGGINIYEYAVNTLRWADPLGLKGGSTELDRNIGGRVGDGMQAHHLIPEEVMDNPAFKDMFDHLESMGFDRNGAANGIHMPGSESLSKKTGMVGHWSNHDMYTADITAKIDKLNTAWSSGKLSDMQLLLGIRNVQSRAFADIESGNVSRALSNACRMG